MRSRSTETSSGLGGGSFSFQQKLKQKRGEKQPVFQSSKAKAAARRYVRSRCAAAIETRDARPAQTFYTLH